MPDETNACESVADCGQNEAWTVNNKMLFDVFLNLGSESIGRSRTHFDKMVSDAQQHGDARQVIANQALQNAVETANLQAKQNLRQTELATDRQWNVDEQGFTVAGILADKTFQDALLVALNQVVADMVTKTPEV